MTMPLPRKKGKRQNERIDLRVSPNDKSLLNKAAAYAKMPLSKFLLSAACERAKDLVSERELFTLLPADWEHFFVTLDKKTKPRPRLEAAAKRYIKKSQKLPHHGH